MSGERYDAVVLGAGPEVRHESSPYRGWSRSAPRSPVAVLSDTIAQFPTFSEACVSALPKLPKEAGTS